MSKLPHLRLAQNAEQISYTSTNTGGGGSFKTPARNPTTHASELKSGFAAARDQAAELRVRERASGLDVLTREPGGLVLTFESEEGGELYLKGLEKIKDGIELRSVHARDGVEMAQVFVADGKLEHFLNLVETYATRTVLTVNADESMRATLEALADKKRKVSVSLKEPLNGKLPASITCPVSESERIITALGARATVSKQVRKNTPLIASIGKVRLALVRDFWAEKETFPDEGEQRWWEVWLHALRPQAESVVERFRTLASDLGIRTSQRYVRFPERVVLLAYGSAAQFSRSLELLSLMAELRKARELAGPYLELPARDQAQFAAAVINNVVPAGNDAPSVCILDRGVNRGHPLLEQALAESEAQSVDESWGAHDHDQDQHGTGMAGIALFGCLTEVLGTDEEIRLRHRLESVKILPPPPRENAPEVYGAVTQQGVSLAMMRRPDRNRAICMAVTASATPQGLPSSWSGAVDEICAGVLDETPKLMFISAGNVRDELFSPDYEYHRWNTTCAGIEDPAQSWNAITVGAFTNKVTIQDPTYAGYEPIADAGDLCPTSRTSLAWPEDHHPGWPIKPDIVCEGGNYGAQGTSRSSVEDLSLLTTMLHPSGRLFDSTRDTSPATALASRMAAQLWSYYPKLRPETVRALLVHSAQWTKAMTGRFGLTNKSNVQKLLRCYGYGVPDLDRAVFSLKNCATLIHEGKLQPFKLDSKKKPATNEMHLHSLPWPQEKLEELGETPVSMRVTLSYFVEPSPGSVGWGANHRYASHGLRFDVIRPLESIAEFKQRISKTQWEDEKVRPKSQSETRNWIVGDKGRTHGSIHSDWWEGSAAELAACGSIAIYPVTGWWRERAHLGRLLHNARYSLVVTLQTANVETDLYTPIKNTASVRVETLMETTIS